MITDINEWKILTKHISSECKCKFDNRKCIINQKWNNNKCLCEYKNPKGHHGCEKDYIWNPTICRCKNGNSVESIINPYHAKSSNSINFLIFYRKKIYIYILFALMSNEEL